MKIEETILEFDKSNNKDIAKAIFNYFLKQFANSIRRQITCKFDLDSMINSNLEYRRRNDLIGFEFRNDPPWNDLQIKNKEKELSYLDEEVNRAESIIDFLRDRLLIESR